MEENKITEQLLEFLDESPTCFHAVSNVEEMLKQAGFEEMEDAAQIKPGGSYYEKRNGSALIAFRVPKKEMKGFRIAASHSDSPCFKVKEAPEMQVENHYVKLNTEKYGGMILSTWLDRPLSVAGRVVVRENGKLEEKLVNIKKDLLIIPNVAIHFNRDVNRGLELNPQVDMLPLMAEEKECSLNALCAEELHVEQEDILGTDLFVYNRDKARMMGADDAFIGAPRLDDLQCAFATLQGFLQGVKEEYCGVYALFDNEEVGSGTKQGADSTFLEDVLADICAGLGISEKEERVLLKNSFLLSADNGHAVHPNHPEKSDPTNRPYLNGGMVLKFHGSQKYTTDAYSAAFVKDICQREKIPYQTFANRSDILGGSTLGNISTAHVSIPSADVGLPQLAMHSAFETAGAKDTRYMVQLCRAFYA